MVPTDLPFPGQGLDEQVPGEPMRVVVDVGRRYHLSVYSFGLACCAVEFVAATYGAIPLSGPGEGAVADVGAGPAAVDVLVVSGTVTDKLAPAIRRFYDQMPEPRYVVAFGACASCGGPYWDSYSVTKGADQLVPVDVYVPGCPPRPEALLHGLRVLHDRIGVEQVPA